MKIETKKLKTTDKNTKKLEAESYGEDEDAE